MRLSLNFLPVFCSLIAQIGFVAAAPVSSNVATQAGGRLPNNRVPTLISQNAIKEFQLTLFLENLEAFFFKSGLANVTTWETTGYSSDTVKIISKIAAVRKPRFIFKNVRANGSHCSKKKFT
jgi:hypothetical protein